MWLGFGYASILTMSSVRSIFDHSRGELKRTLSEWGESRFRTGQVINWLYGKLVFDPARMSDLPLALRRRLAAEFSFELPMVDGRDRADDGTVKYRLRLTDGEAVECVMMPDADGEAGGVSLCLSTQAGCPLACAFCRTGMAGFRRNLSAGEIVTQALIMFSELSVRPRHADILLMGMGEPLLNAEAVVDALAVFSDKDGLAVPMRRMVVSTAGVPEGIRFLRSSSKLPGLPLLALSLNAPGQGLRETLMPVARKYPLEDLLAALGGWPTGRERMTIEYVLLRGVNDGEKDARDLARLLSRLRRRIKINLIPHNRCRGIPFEPPDELVIDRFLRVLSGEGFRCTVRRSRGSCVSAACGQLAVD